uniref:Uncharacterized protein n=1 Tax=Pseudomonas syringae pv. actinidiae TaxID=103796 RepID=A0A2P0QG26_PSESF|nr:hypothetical protein [Pseudomonas syringae pv. actinidiae]
MDRKKPMNWLSFASPNSRLLADARFALIDKHHEMDWRTKTG